MAIVLRAGAARLVLAQEELQSLEAALTNTGAVPAQLPMDPYGRTVRGSRPEIQQFAQQIAELRSTHRAGRVAELVRERGIRARTPALVELAVAPLLAGDRDLATLDRLLGFLEEVAAVGACPLLIDGD